MNDMHPVPEIQTMAGVVHGTKISLLRLLGLRKH